MLFVRFFSKAIRLEECCARRDNYIPLESQYKHVGSSVVSPLAPDAAMQPCSTLPHDIHPVERYHGGPSVENAAKTV